MKLRSRSQHGFTLVEILVGVGIGIIGIMVMFRMVALFDGHNRSAASGSDAQVSGTLAMFSLERDLKQAGMGFGNADAPFLGCANVIAQNAGTAINIPFFVPVRIVPGAGGGPDQIEVLYGDSSFYGGNAPAPDPAVPGGVLRRDLQFKTSTATTKTLERRGMFRAGDLAIVAGNETAAPGSATCHLIEITATSNPDNLTIDHGIGNYVSFYSTTASGVARFNPPGGTGGVFASGRIYNLGPNPSRNIWQVRADGTLTRSDALQLGPPIDVAERVVNMKAEYGVDTDGDRIPDTWTTVAPADWTTVLAVRTAVLVRSRQYEKSIDPNTNLPFPVTPSVQNPCWADCAGVHRFVMTNVDGSADLFGDAFPDPNNWRYYRYRVYERVIPIRNMLWGTAP